MSADSGEDGHRCTGLAATWCPIHGDCTCERREDGEVEFTGLHGCPLHDVHSPHAAVPADRCPTCDGTGTVLTGGTS